MLAYISFRRKHVIYACVCRPLCATLGGMKTPLCHVLLPLLLVSCVGSKDFTVNTFPEGADITINGEFVGKSPVTTQIKQDKTLGIVAYKSGYEVASETINPVSSKFLSFIWTESDPKSKYIEEDAVSIPLRKIPTPATYTPSKMPAYTGGGGSTRSVLPEAPALRPMPQLD